MQNGQMAEFSTGIKKSSQKNKKSTVIIYHCDIDFKNTSYCLFTYIMHAF